MAKVQKFAEIVPNLPFSEYDFYDLYRSTFEQSELGRIRRLLPLREMAESFGLVRKSMRPKAGRRSFFTPEGKVALMFLKMHTGLSCPRLMEQLNGNIHYQIFCDVMIDLTRPLTNYKLLDDIVLELAQNLKIQQQQGLLAEKWKPYMKDLETMYTDATCYESEMRHPTDPKLLWEGIEKSYGIMCEISSRLGLRRPRTKYLDVEKANLSYRKMRRRTRSQTRKMTRRLLDLLGKILKEIRRMEREKNLVRRELARVRATSMEGSFGTQKEHYGLKRVKARTKLTEILYIFFGIHTANVVQLAERIESRTQLAAA